MDSDINPTLLLGIIGGVLLFGATTMINGTIWATSIDMTTPGRDIDSVRERVGDRTAQESDDRKPVEEYTPFRVGDTRYWAIGRPSDMPRSAPIDCGQPALGPGDALLDMICEDNQ